MQNVMICKGKNKTTNKSCPEIISENLTFLA